MRKKHKKTIVALLLFGFSAVTLNLLSTYILPKEWWFIAGLCYGPLIMMWIHFLID